MCTIEAGACLHKSSIVMLVTVVLRYISSTLTLSANSLTANQNAFWPQFKSG